MPIFRNTILAVGAMLIVLLLCHNMDAGTDPLHHTFKPYRFSFDTLLAKQDSADTAHVVKHRKFTPGIAWASNNTYQGRRDSVNHYLLSPSFAYEGKYGVAASITASHASASTDPPKKDKNGKIIKPAKTPTFDECDLALGYEHDWTDNFNSGILETHNYFDARSARLQSTVDNDVNLNSSYDFKYIAAEAEADWAHGLLTKYGRSKDYFYTFVLSHDYEFDKIFHSRVEMDIEPKFDAVYGSQTFLQIYTLGIPSGYVRGSAASDALQKADYRNELSKYVWLNDEFKLPVTFTNDKWAIGAEWDYEIPQNVPKGNESTPFSVFILKLTYTFKTIN